MKEYQKRVIQEQKELGEKIVKLTTFLMFFDLQSIGIDIDDDANLQLLYHQLSEMLSYNQTLQKRIYLFKE